MRRFCRAGWLKLLLWLSIAWSAGFPAEENRGAGSFRRGGNLQSEPSRRFTRMPDDVGELIISPVPGTVLEVMVSVGDGVRRGSPLMLLGAMSMEYEINASTDGTVTQIFVSAGAAVEAGTPLIEIR